MNERLYRPIHVYEFRNLSIYPFTMRWSERKEKKNFGNLQLTQTEETKKKLFIYMFYDYVLSWEPDTFERTQKPLFFSKKKIPTN
jgi:hypothetical protein